MDDRILEKVTAFITRQHEDGADLLLFQHPNAGIQIPAGTVEEGETPERAALREAHEETGLAHVCIVQYIGYQDEARPEGEFVVCKKTKVYARPDSTSFDWAEFRRGIQVRQLRQEGAFLQVTYEEGDRFPDPRYVTYQITGWVPQHTLCRMVRRHFFHLVLESESPGDAWTTFADQHIFRPFWASLQRLPPIVEPQSGWLEYVQRALNYRFGKE